MTRPGSPSSRGRHSAPEEGARGPGRHAAPDENPPIEAPAAPPRRRHAAEEDDAFTGYGGDHSRPGGSYRDRDEPVPPANGYHAAEPVMGFPYTAPPPDAPAAWPVNGHGLDRAERDASSWPVNGHGLDRAERDAAAWPVNGHGPSRPVNGHGPNGSVNGHGAVGPVNGSTAAWPRDGDPTPRPTYDHEPGAPVNGNTVAWPLPGGEPDGPVDGSAAWPVNGHAAAPPIDGHDAPPVNGHTAVNGHAAVNGGAPVPLAGWQREPFRPSYPTAPPREIPPATIPPPAPVSPPPPARPSETALPPSPLRPSGTDRSSSALRPSGPALPPATARPSGAGVLPGTALPAGGVGPATEPPVAPAAFALDADDESTQVLRRYVPAAETLGREQADRPAGRPAKPPHPPRAVVRRRQTRRRRLEWPLLIVFALVSAYLIRAYVVQTFYIPSASMHETLIEGDRVLVNKISYRVHDVHRGDVIVFTKPPKLVADEDDLIKRVVGLPGETVEGRGGKIYINGAPLTEPYVAPSCSVATSDFAPVRVPAGDLWVMGDNRCNSSDSRYFGVIGENTVVGRAFVLVWPVGRFSGL
jgi:signal peptidase I